MAFPPTRRSSLARSKQAKTTQRVIVFAFRQHQMRRVVAPPRPRRGSSFARSGHAGTAQSVVGFTCQTRHATSTFQTTSPSSAMPGGGGPGSEAMVRVLPRFDATPQCVETSSMVVSRAVRARPGLYRIFLAKNLIIHFISGKPNMIGNFLMRNPLNPEALPFEDFFWIHLTKEIWRSI